jgi:hypoxanthine phosphoribosyltransferase
MSILIPAPTIKRHIKTIGDTITKKHQPDMNNVVMICLLNGGFMFFTDLIRKIDLNIQCDFMRVKSYDGQEQSELQIIKDIELDLTGKHVYIVDDFFDSGNTMNAVHEHLKSHNPASLTAITLLKRYRCKRPTYPFVYGIEVNKEWVYGYGMDNNGGYCRNLDAIYKI